MDDLAKKQVAITESLQKAFINTKKDSTSRKTSEYIKKRREDIAASWKKFSQQHTKILELNCQDHDYMTLNYYSQSHKMVMDYEKYLDEIEASLVRGSPAPERKQLEQPKPSEESKTTPENILVRKQVSRINRINKLLEDTESEMSSEHSVKYWEFKKDSINQQWMSIQQLQEDIELEGDTGLTIESFQDVEKKVLDVIEKLCEIISNETKPTEKLQLPRIDVPHFDGKFESWSSFHDLFVRFIHSNKKLGNVEKMQFLKSRVKGEASKLLQHLPITDINYESAWSIIKNRYNNKRMILFTYINNIFSVPKVASASASELKLIYDTVVEGLRGINTLGINTDTWDSMVIYILQEKLDRETLRLYEQSLKCPKEIPQLEDLLTFMETRFSSLEMQNRKGSTVNNSGTTGKKETNFRKDNFRFSHHTKSQNNCPFCKEGHKIYACKKFADQTVKDRISFVKNRNLCANCLHHDATSKCFSKNTCSRCKKEHHTLLHPEQNEEGRRDVQVTTITQVPSANKKDSEVLLTTAMIKVKKYEGTWEFLRALIDPGSQCSFITEEAAESLGRPRKRACLTISGVGGAASQISTKGKMTVDMKPRMTSNFHLRCDLLILNKLTSSTPSEDTEEIISNHDTNLLLADPTYNISGPIDVLIGSDIIPSILKNGVKKQKGCLLQNTEFGWIISGPTKLSGEAPSDNLRSMIVIAEEPQLTRFWEIEEVIPDVQPTDDDKSCEANYDATTTREECGRYSVRLPFKQPVIDLGESKKTAVARLLQMEKKFRNNPQLEADYKNFMKEYEEMGHMVLAEEQNKARYYIPHHAVIKEDSTTTKLRVVFDASARSSTGKCLNEVMFTGPRLQEDLSQILLRWRKHEITLTADIEKMYRQVKIHRDDQLFQTILWRYDTTEPIKEYRLTTVTYGTSAAPYLAVKTLQRLANDELENHTLASQVATRDYYVDDLLTGADSIQQARILQQEMITMLKKGGFNLRKWMSNRRELIDSLPNDLQDKHFLEIAEDDTKKMLGVHWAPLADKFKYRVKVVVDENPTKRKILSHIAQLYDPLGWLQPIIITAKILIQELWKNDSKWDEVVPTAIKTKWVQFQVELPHVEEIDIPRWINFKPENVSTELHGFCDASELAYGAVLYSRTTDKNELCGPLLLANHVKAENTQWHFIPPEAPHFGGIWEAGVKSKRLLSGNTTLIFDKTSNGNQYKRPITKLCPLPVDHDLDTAENRSTKRNTTLTAVNAVTFILVAMLSTITCCVASPYTIKSPGPGIYIEHMGEALLHRGAFRLDIPINISKLEEQGALVNQTLQQVQEVCQVGKTLTDIKCDLFIQELENKYNELQVNMQIITNGYHFRAKRGILGQLLTSVFGVNDEVYTDIADLNKNQQKLIQSSKHQTSIMVKSLTSLNKTEQRITEKLNQFTQKLNHGLDEIHQMQWWYRTVDVNKINIHILYVHQLAKAVMGEVEDHVRKLIKIIHHQGDVLDFLTIAEFHRVITNTTVNLPSHLSILTDHIIRLSMVREEKQIMVQAYYHIAEKSSYEVINVTPIPQRVQSSSFTAIVTDSPLLAVDYNKQHYFELSYEEFRQAVRLGDSKILLSADIIHDLNQDPSCTIDIIYSRTKTNTCPQRSFKVHHVLWKRLFMLNTWLFVANTPKRVSLECGGQRSDLWLNETGILQVDQDCTVDTGRKLLKADINRSIQGVSAFHMPLTLPPIDSWHPLDHPSSSKEQEPVFNLDEDFTHLLEDEKSLAFNLTDDTWETIHPHVTTSGISVLTTILVVAPILIIIWIIRCRRQKKASSKPNFNLARQDV